MADNTTGLAYLTMADLTAQEEKLAQQQALAQQLRGVAAPMQRMDKGSQAARAISGLMSGLAMRKSNQQIDQMSQDRRKLLSQIAPAFGGGQQNLPIAPPSAPIDYSQFGDYWGPNG